MANPVGNRPSNVSAEDWQQLQNALQHVGANSQGIDPRQLASAHSSQLGNDPAMEAVWAEKAFKHAETYFKLITSLPNTHSLKLTRIDENIYTHFRQEFPDLNVEKLYESQLKNAAAKSKWRQFCEVYNNHPQLLDYNFGTLLRLNCREDYNEANCTIVPRIQFWAIEIARLREGKNQGLKKSS